VLEAELRELETAGRRAIGERILTARELGDLKDTAELASTYRNRRRRVLRHRPGD
jgi:transcription elongation GreA/GreB family factor